MAYRRRRRKPRVAWLTNIGQQTRATFEVEESASWQTFSFNAVSGDVSIVDVGLIVDRNITAELGTNFTVHSSEALTEAQQFGYRIRRVVGKFFASIGPTSAQGAPAGGMLGAGLIVGNADKAGAMQAERAEVDPQSILGAKSPWFWRREWLLGTGAGGPVGTDARLVSNFPSTTAGYGGGTYDGGHIDAKTNRVVGTDQRLYLVVSYVPLPLPLADGGDEHRVFFAIDYRVLATIIPTQGNRRRGAI